MTWLLGRLHCFVESHDWEPIPCHWGHDHCALLYLRCRRCGAVR